MLERHSWKVFVLVGAIGAVFSVVLAIEPTVAFGMFAPVAPPLAPGASADPFTLFLVRWTATALAGSNVLTIAIASTAFRRGERWAGIALVYWPLMFASHLAMYRFGPMSLVQVAWLALTLPALVEQLTRRPRAETAATGTALAGA